MSRGNAEQPSAQAPKGPTSSSPVETVVQGRQETGVQVRQGVQEKPETRSPQDQANGNGAQNQTPNPQGKPPQERAAGGPDKSSQVSPTARRIGGRLVSLPTLAVRSRQVQSKRARTASARTLVKSSSRPGVQAQQRPGEEVRDRPEVLFVHSQAPARGQRAPRAVRRRKLSRLRPHSRHLSRQHSPRPAARQPKPPPPKINLEPPVRAAQRRPARPLPGRKLKVPFPFGIRRRHHNPSNRYSRG